jgi:subtilisin family serine protease
MPSHPTMVKVLNALLFVLFVSSASARVGSTHRFLPAENGNGIPGEYVVLLSDNANPRGILNGVINGGKAEELLNGGKAEELQVYTNSVKGFAIRGMKLTALVNALKHLDSVLITENQLVEIGSVQTPVASWGIDRVDQFTGTDNQYSYERDGSNVDVYIVDTGIDTNHEDFGGRASFGIDVSGSGEGDNDYHGHGTHVAGTVGGTKYGIAKNANLIAVKVFDGSGSGTVANVLAGIDWVVGRARPNGAVVNLSIDAEVVIESINVAVNEAVSAGIVMVVAGGNSNADACSTTPASATDAITVGATDTNDYRAAFSNFGTCIDIFAPGKSIISAKANTITGSLILSGTSMATPHVAGVAALLLEEDPGISPAEVLAKMLASATAGEVMNRGAGSPNLMLYSGDIAGPAPAPAPAPEPAPEPAPAPAPEPEPAPAPAPAPEPAPAPVCFDKSISCTANSQCCSKKCKGGRVKSCK